jgi:formyltetrahydrofolate-dependent phosphoribosylglycinamide formyltransferase
VLASGSGTNLQAIIDHLRALGGDSPGTVALVASDRADAGALERARRAAIPAITIPGAHTGTALLDALRAYRIDMIALAGYLRLIPANVIEAYRGRIVNVHPALLPAFGGPGMYGRRVHEAVLASGAAESGVTVHLVDEVYDHGDTIAQARVPVDPNDTAATLADRVLAAEHALYPKIVEQMMRQIAAAQAGTGPPDI